MITFHFHLQPQYKYELFHINFNIIHVYYLTQVKIRIWFIHEIRQ